MASSHTTLLQTLNKLAGSALDNLVTILVEHREDRQTQSKVTAQESTLLEQHNLSLTALSSSLCRHNAGRATTYDQYIYLCTNSNLSCRLKYSLHSFSQLESQVCIILKQCLLNLSNIYCANLNAISNSDACSNTCSLTQSHTSRHYAGSSHSLVVHS